MSKRLPERKLLPERLSEQWSEEEVPRGPGAPAERLRLDSLLVRRGLAETRARARDAVLRGHVRVDGALAAKPGQSISANAALDVDDPGGAYVSRGALKLAAALDRFGVDVAGRTALDLGASTGGFTDVLLRRGAGAVIAIDVGHGQMHPRLAADPRVSLIEGLNARDLGKDHLGGRSFDRLVADVSFISLRLALPPALRLAEPGTVAILLVKPQFEAGRAAIGKGGLLRNPGDGVVIAAGIVAWLDREMGWRAGAPIASPILGGDGNAEFLVKAVKA